MNEEYQRIDSPLSAAGIREKLCEQCNLNNTGISLRGAQRLKYCDECLKKDKNRGFRSGKVQKIRCIRCKESKDYTEFNIDQHHNTGRQRLCRDPCAKEYHKEWKKKTGYKNPKGTSLSPVMRLLLLHKKIKVETDI